MTTGLRIGVAGCGHAAQIHVRRLLAVPGVHLAGCADPNLGAAHDLAAQSTAATAGQVPTFTDHKDLLKQVSPDALAIFTPHLAHYRPAMDALQLGCHVFIEKPLSTNAQEGVDIVGLARARNRKLAVGHQYRLRPSLIEARKRLKEGTIGPVRMITATMAVPWLAAHRGPEDSWRLDPRTSGGGILADAGDHVIDALLWTTGRRASLASAFQSRLETGLDVVTGASVCLDDGTLATLAITGVSSAELFEIDFFGETGWLRATGETLIQNGTRSIALPEPSESIDGNFISAIVNGTPLCCPGEEALDTVRLLEALARSSATGQTVRVT
jgi:predicted dehydrogenase